MPIHLHEHMQESQTSEAVAHKPTQSQLKVLLAGGVIIIAGLMLMLGVGRSNRIVIAQADGTVQVYNEAGNWETATVGSRLKAGAKIRTGEGAQAMLDVGKRSALRLAASTELEVEQADARMLRARLQDGRVYSRVNVDDDVSWSVVAQDVFVTADGTAYAVSSDTSAKRVAVDVIDHSVTVRVSKADGELETQASAGTYLAISLNKPVLESMAKAEIRSSDAQRDPFLAWNFAQDTARGFDLGVFALEQPATEGTVSSSEPVVPVEEGASPPSAATPSDVPAATTVTVPGIALSAKQTTGGIALTWAMTGGLTAPHGFRVVTSTNRNPIFPSDTSVVLASSSTRAFTWKVEDGLTHHYRVCTYDGVSGCASYSNDVSVKAPSKPATAVSDTANELQLTATRTDQGISLHWTKRTSSTFAGYKLLRSTEDPNLSYPKTSFFKSFADRTATAYLDTGAPLPGKIVYYRVCSEETGGAPVCGNVVKMQ